MALGHKASQLRHEQKISLSSVVVKHSALMRVVRLLIFILMLPYSLPAMVLTLPIVGLCKFIFTHLKDYAFRNSVRYFINLIVWPVLMIIYAVVAYAVLPWQWALVGTIAALPAPIVAHEVYRLVRILRSDIRLLRNRDLRAIYAKIREIIFTK
jgi:hypothetical protein